MGDAQVKAEQMEIVDYVKNHFIEWMEEKHVFPFPQNAAQNKSSYDPLLMERMVRVEEGIKHQNENLEKMMIQSDKRFAEVNENMNRRFEEVNENMNRRFEEVNENMNRRFEEVNENMNRRFAEVNETMDRRFTEVNETMDRRFTEVNENMNGRFEFMDKRFNRLYLFLTGAFFAVLTGIVTLLIQSL
jgi:predicted transcriptional regulator